MAQGCWCSGWHLENCSDIRNSKIFDLVENLRGFHCDVDVYDPLVDKDEVASRSGVNLVSEPQFGTYDGLF